MGNVGVLIINTIVALITVLSLILGFLSYKTYKTKKQIYEDEVLVRCIMLLKEAEKKLNAALKSHDRRLDNHLHEISDIKDRLDILESGHPDSDIDYATLDDHDEVVEVWFEGKRYVPEDKKDEDTVAFYADGRVVAETTRPEETRCCATCQYYQPESGYSTCDLRTWLHVTKKYATMTDSACNNYEKAYTHTKGQVDYPYIRFNHIYKDMDGNDKTEELLKRVEDLNYFYNAGLMSAATYMHRWEELMQNDT